MMAAKPCLLNILASRLGFVGRNTTMPCALAMRGGQQKQLQSTLRTRLGGVCLAAQTGPEPEFRPVAESAL